MKRLTIPIQFVRKALRRFFKRYPALALAFKVALYSAIAVGVFLHFVPKHTLWGYALHTLVTLVVAHSLTDLIWRVVFGPEQDRQLRLLVRACFDDSLRQHVLQLNRKLDQLICIKKLLQFGIKAIHTHLNYARLFVSLKPGDTLLWLDTFHPDAAVFHREAKEAIARGANIHMLIQNPDCITAEHRAAELLRPPFFSKDNYKRALTDFYQKMHDLAAHKDQERGEFLVRVYDDLPCVPMYLIIRDGNALSGFNGFFLNDATAYDCPHIEWSFGPILNSFAEYFSRKWEKHEPTQVPRPVQLAA